MNYRVTREQKFFAMSADLSPVVTVPPGSTLTLETEDCVDGRVPYVADYSYIRQVDAGYGNPAAGPVAVSGALPGMSLVADILAVRPASQGLIWAEDPASGEGDMRVPNVHADCVEFAEGWRFALRPVVGVIGVAPPGEAVPNSTPGVHGGNLDCTDVGVGAVVYLPVFAPGALFGCGDLHAVQGDGEMAGMGVETAGEVDVRLSLRPRQAGDWPVVETAGHFSISTAAQTLDEAAALAVAAGRNFLVQHGGMSANEATMALSMVCDLRINQVVNPLMGVRVCIPRTLVAALRLSD